MNKPMLEQLIQQEIDGVNSEEESRRLMKLVDSSEQARERYMEMVGLCENLNEVASVEPPAELRQNINEAISRAHHGRTQGPRTSQQVGLWQRTWRRTSMFLADSVFARPGYAFAGGISAAMVILVAAVTIIGIGNDGSQNQFDKIVGTLLRPGELAQSSSEESKLTVGDAEVSLELTWDESAVVFSVSSVNLPCRVEIVPEPNQANINAVLCDEPADTQVEWSEGKVKVTFEAPSAVHLVLTRMASDEVSTLRVTMHFDGAEATREFVIKN